MEIKLLNQEEMRKYSVNYTTVITPECPLHKNLT